jgi:hypothetical protein
MINAYKAGEASTKANNKYNKRIQKQVRRHIIVWHFLTKIAISKCKYSAKIRYRTKYKDSLFMEGAVEYLRSLGYAAEYQLHEYGERYCLYWSW